MVISLHDGCVLLAATFAHPFTLGTSWYSATHEKFSISQHLNSNYRTSENLEVNLNSELSSIACECDTDARPMHGRKQSKIILLSAGINLAGTGKCSSLYATILTSSSRQSSARERDDSPVHRTGEQPFPDTPRFRVPTLDGGKGLHEAHHEVRGFGQGVLLTHADARSAVEWDVIPTRSQRFPPLWAEFESVLPEEVFAAVLREHAVEDDGALGEEDGRSPVGPAAAR